MCPSRTGAELVTSVTRCQIQSRNCVTWSKGKRHEYCCNGTALSWTWLPSRGKRDSLDMAWLSPTGARAEASVTLWIWRGCPQQEPELIHVVPSSALDEALARYSDSREVPRSVLKCETVLSPLMRPQMFLDTPV